MGDGSMTRAEREAFLADVHIGVLSVEDPGRGPFTVPVWYLVRGGEVLVHMDRTSKKARLIQAAGRASLVAQSEEPPYRYVSIEGPATVAAPDLAIVEMASRYLGPELGEWYAQENPATEDSVVVHLVPEHWNTMDYTKLLG
jgi:uncharacterized protein